jgi:hypothetical protein
LVLQRRQGLGINRHLLQCRARHVEGQRIVLGARERSRRERQWERLSLVRAQEILDVAVSVEDDVGNSSERTVLGLNSEVQQISHLQKA